MFLDCLFHVLLRGHKTKMKTEMKISQKILVYSLCLLLILFASCTDAKRSKTTSQPKSSLKKCNLRTEYWEEEKTPEIVAVAKMRRQIESMNVNGTIVFEQQGYRRPMRIRGNISGLDPSGKHGLFITTLGIRGCNWPQRRSGHYNPFDADHGDASSCWRHVGDLEVVKANQEGGANFSQFDARVQLQGVTSIVGRQVVILFKSDDNPSGTSTRVSCGVIGYAHGSRWVVTKFDTPAPENGLAYAYGGCAFLVALLSFIWMCKEEQDRKRKDRPVFESSTVANRHRKIVERHRKQLR